MIVADVAVVGGASAAAAAALTLAAANLRVVAVAPRPAERDRPGDVLAAPGTALLAELGLGTERFARARRTANTFFSSWGSAALVERNAFAGVGGAGWVLDRPAYDRTLWNAVADTVETIEARVERSHWDGEAWHLETTGGVASVAARFVVDCSGRSAVVARGVRGGVIRADRLVAVYAFLEQAAGDVDPTPATLVEAAPDGWWYAALLPDRRLSLAFFTDAELVPRAACTNAGVFRQAIAQTQYVRQWIESADFAFAEPPRIASAASVASVRAAGDNWAAAGDAAVTFDPLSSHGLSSALWSGRHAALAAVEALEGRSERLRRYADSIQAAARRNRLERRAVYGAERRFGDRPFWRRRIAPEPVTAVLAY